MIDRTLMTRLVFLLLAVLLLGGMDYKRKKKVVTGGMVALATDPFTGASGSLSANWVSPVPTGAGSSVVLNANTAVDSSADGTDAGARYTAITWPNDQYAQCKLVTLATNVAGAGPMVRVSTSGANTFYRVTVKGPMGATAVLRIEKLNAGSYSNLTGNVTITAAANDIIKLVVTTSGGNAVLTAYQNSTQRATFTDTTSVIASGQAGIALFVDGGANTDAACDDWEGGG